MPMKLTQEQTPRRLSVFGLQPVLNDIIYA